MKTIKMRNGNNGLTLKLWLWPRSHVNADWYDPKEYNTVTSPSQIRGKQIHFHGAAEMLQVIGKLNQAQDRKNRKRGSLNLKGEKGS
jgi:hypothetical protein